METMIRFLLENFTLTLLVLGLVASAIALLRTSRPWTASVVTEAVISYFILFSIALSYLYNFVLHVFFGEMTAHFIGWADSPFQREVGFASLGFAAVGFLAFRGSFDMRVAAVVGPGVLPAGCGRRAHPGDHEDRQPRTRQRGRDSVYRHPASVDQHGLALASTPVFACQRRDIGHLDANASNASRELFCTHRERRPAITSLGAVCR